MLNAHDDLLLGAKLYASSQEHGFLYCVIATTIVYALILQIIPWIPKQLIATADGVRNLAVEAEMMAEIAAGKPQFSSYEWYKEG